MQGNLSRRTDKEREGGTVLKRRRTTKDFLYRFLSLLLTWQRRPQYHTGKSETEERRVSQREYGL